MHQGVLLLLAREGANLDVKDNHGHTIWELAKNIAPDGKLAQGIIGALRDRRSVTRSVAAHAMGLHRS